MARLIKMSNAPTKWILKKRLMLLPRGRIIKGAEHSNRQKALLSFEDQRLSVRRMAEDYYKKKSLYLKAAADRSHRQQLSALVIETLLEHAEMIHNMDDESEAVEQIANRIAANITTCSDLALRPDELAQLKEEMARIFFITLIIPHYHYAHIVPFQEELSRHYRGFLKLEPGIENEEAKLVVSASGGSCAIEFYVEDLVQIVEAVLSSLRAKAL